MAIDKNIINDIRVSLTRNLMQKGISLNGIGFELSHLDNNTYQILVDGANAPLVFNAKYSNNDGKLEFDINRVRKYFQQTLKIEDPEINNFKQNINTKPKEKNPIKKPSPTPVNPSIKEAAPEINRNKFSKEQIAAANTSIKNQTQPSQQNTQNNYILNSDPIYAYMQSNLLLNVERELIRRQLWNQFEIIQAANKILQTPLTPEESLNIQTHLKDLNEQYQTTYNEAFRIDKEVYEGLNADLKSYAIAKFDQEKNVYYTGDKDDPSATFQMNNGVLIGMPEIKKFPASIIIEAKDANGVVKGNTYLHWDEKGRLTDFDPAGPLYADITDKITGKTVQQYIHPNDYGRYNLKAGELYGKGPLYILRDGEKCYTGMDYMALTSLMRERNNAMGISPQQQLQSLAAPAPQKFNGQHVPHPMGHKYEIKSGIDKFGAPTLSIMLNGKETPFKSGVTNYVTIDMQGNLSASTTLPAWMRVTQMQQPNYSQPIQGQAAQNQAWQAPNTRQTIEQRVETPAEIARKKATEKFFANSYKAPDIIASTNDLNTNERLASAPANAQQKLDAQHREAAQGRFKALPSDRIYEEIRSFEMLHKVKSPLIAEGKIQQELNRDLNGTLAKYSEYYGPEFKKHMVDRGLLKAPKLQDIPKVARASANVQQELDVQNNKPELEATPKPSLWARFKNMIGIKNAESVVEKDSNTPPIGSHRADASVSTQDVKQAKNIEKQKFGWSLPIKAQKNIVRIEKELNQYKGSPQEDVAATVSKPLPPTPGKPPVPSKPLPQIPPAKVDKQLPATPDEKPAEKFPGSSKPLPQVPSVPKVSKPLPSTPPAPKVNKPLPSTPPKETIDGTGKTDGTAKDDSVANNQNNENNTKRKRDDNPSFEPSKTQKITPPSKEGLEKYVEEIDRTGKDDSLANNPNNAKRKKSDSASLEPSKSQKTTTPSKEGIEQSVDKIMENIKGVTEKKSFNLLSTSVKARKSRDQDKEKGKGKGGRRG
jgi:hypothetical protein